MGGDGTKGQNGGKGAKGIRGKDASNEIKKGDPADTKWGHIDERHGSKGKTSGSGGTGGNGGIGGEGGEHGNILIETDLNHLKDKILKVDGNNGDNGEPGIGGDAGEAEVDGLDCFFVKGGCFSKRHEIHGYELIRTGSSDRKPAGWTDGVSIEKMKERNQGKKGEKGKTKEEQAKARNKAQTHQIKREKFVAHVNEHLRTETAENKSNAFDEVTNRLAVARENAESANEALALQEKKLKSIDELYEKTLQIMQQTETEETVQKEHTRLATLTRTESQVSQQKEIEAFLKSKERDNGNLIPFLKCSPILRRKGVFTLNLETAARDANLTQSLEPESFAVRRSFTNRECPAPLQSDSNSRSCANLASRTAVSRLNDVDLAIHEVNMTHGQNIQSIAKLIFQITLLKRPYDEDKRKCLCTSIVNILQEIHVKFAVEHFDEVIKAARNLQSAENLMRAIQKKAEEVKSFNQTLDEESDAINRFAEKEAWESVAEAKILKYLSGDRLLFRYLTTSLSQKDEKYLWILKRLCQKALTIAKHHDQVLATKEIVTHLLKIGKSVLQDLSSMIPNSNHAIAKEIFKKFFGDCRQELQIKIKLLRFQQRWLLENLKELCAEKLNFTKLQKKHDTLTDIYSESLKGWINIAGHLPKKTQEFPREAQLPETVESKQIDVLRKKGLKAESLTRFEAHLVSLQTLQGKVVDLNAFYDALARILNDKASFGLDDLFVALSLHYKDLKIVLNEMRNLSTDNLDEIVNLRSKYFNEKNLQVNANIYLFLENRHLHLLKERCVEILKGKLAEGHEQIEEWVLTKLHRANHFFSMQEHFPEVDFLALSAEVIVDPKYCQEDIDCDADLLKHCVSFLLPSVDVEKKEDLIDGLTKALKDKSHDLVRGYLFVLNYVFLSTNRNVSTLWER